MSRRAESSAQGRAGGSLSESDRVVQQWHEDIGQYERTLEEMANATLDQDFKDELSAIEQWLRVLSEPERTASIYAFMQQTTHNQVEFFIKVLQQMRGPKHDASTGETTELSEGAQRILLALRKQVEDASEVIKSLKEQNASLATSRMSLRDETGPLDLERLVQELTDENRRFAREMARTEQSVLNSQRYEVLAASRLLELDELQRNHESLTTEIDSIVCNEVKTATSEKDKEIKQLRRELEVAKQGLIEANTRNSPHKDQLQRQSFSNADADEDGGASDITMAFQGQSATRVGADIEPLEREQERVGALERELRSHQQANESFQSTLREIGEIIESVCGGDLSKRVMIRPAELDSEIVRFKLAINIMMSHLQYFTSEVSRVARDVGTEGRLGGQTEVMNIGGIWEELVENVNTMAVNVTMHVREIAEVATSIANGDLTRKMEQPAQGEILVLKETINYMVDQLRTNIVEVTRVAREVGTNGKLGGQADVGETKGVWNTLAVTVNAMAQSLTDVVRQTATVTKAVAYGDDTQQRVEEARVELLDLRRIYPRPHGEIRELQRTINAMIIRLQDQSAAKSQNEGHDEHAMRELRDVLLAEQTLRQNTGALKLDIDALQREVRDLTSERDFLAGQLERRTIDTSTGPSKHPAEALHESSADSSDNEAIPSQTAAEQRDDEEVPQHSGTQFSEGNPLLDSQSVMNRQQKEQRERLNRIWTILHSAL